jgi:hypothetical protein
MPATRIVEHILSDFICENMWPQTQDQSHPPRSFPELLSCRSLLKFRALWDVRLCCSVGRWLHVHSPLPGTLGATCVSDFRIFSFQIGNTCLYLSQTRRWLPQHILTSEATQNHHDLDSAIITFSVLLIMTCFLFVFSVLLIGQSWILSDIFTLQLNSGSQNNKKSKNTNVLYQRIAGALVFGRNADTQLTLHTYILRGVG